MQHLFQSTFLQALGYAIANSLWQTALVWLIYMSVTGLLAVSAAAKYRLAVAAQVMGFVWFMITFQFYYHQYSNAWQLSGTIAVSQDIQAIVSSNTDFSTRLINWMIKGEQLLPYVSMAYLLLMLFLCTRWFFGYRQTQLIRNNGLQKMPANWRLFVKKIAAQLGINKEIRIFLSDSVTTPLTMGFLKPVILIPVASINHLTTDQLEAVLLHELAHIKRYDYLVNIILSVVEISL
jgi:bla regulator protein BlaR1